MLGHNAHRVAGLGVHAVGPAAQLLDPADQRREEVRLVERGDVLQDHGGPLEPQPGVDAGGRKGGACAVQVVIELHEHQVPQLHEPVADVSGLVHRIGAVGAAVGPEASPLRAEVVVELAARAAGTLQPRRAPPVVLVAEPVYPVRGYSGRPPQVERLVVVQVYRYVEAVLGQAQPLGHELQAEGYGVLFEVVADAEVAQHLEQGEVGRIADLVDVHRPERLLGGREPPVGGRRLAGEVGLELDHPGGRQQQCRVADRDQRRAGHPEVALRLEVGQKRFPDLVACHVTPILGCDGIL